MSPFSPQPGGGGGGGAALLLEFHWLTILALLLGATGLAISRIVALPPDQRPRWTRRHGRLVEWVANASGSIACAGVAWWLSVHLRVARNELQAGLLLLLLCLSAGQAARAFVAWAVERSHIWAIRHGDAIGHWVVRLTLIGLLLTVVYILRTQT